MLHVVRDGVGMARRSLLGLVHQVASSGVARVGEHATRAADRLLLRSTGLAAVAAAGRAVDAAGRGGGPRELDVPFLAPGGLQVIKQVVSEQVVLN